MGGGGGDRTKGDSRKEAIWGQGVLMPMVQVSVRQTEYTSRGMSYRVR